MTGAPVPTRRDAARNRELLLAAARTVLAAHGADAPLELIAREAGVSRTTLHRHFPDRTVLVATILEDTVRRIEERSAQLSGRPDALVLLLHEILRMQAAAPWLSQVVGAADGEAIAALSRRIEAALAPLVGTAQAAGLTHPGVGTSHVLLALPMAMAVAPGRAPAVREILHRGLFTTPPPAP